MEKRNFLENALAKVMRKKEGEKSASELQKEALLGKYEAGIVGKVDQPAEDVAKRYEEAKGDEAWREQK